MYVITVIVQNIAITSSQLELFVLVDCRSALLIYLSCFHCNRCFNPYNPRVVKYYAIGNIRVAKIYFV
jgi:hypothetical protein